MTEEEEGKEVRRRRSFEAVCVLGCVLLLVYTQQGCMVQEEKGAVVWFGLHQGGGVRGAGRRWQCGMVRCVLSL